jgi:hypothetical protein
MVSEENLNVSRSKVITEFLLEMNNDVKGSSIH